MPIQAARLHTPLLSLALALPFVVCACADNQADAEIELAPMTAATHNANAPASGAVSNGAINPRLLRRFREVARDPMERSRATKTPSAFSAAAVAEQVELGRMLWFDTRLSRGNDLSCNSCHDLEHFGVDGKRVSLGHMGKAGRRNSPSVYNAGGRFVQFWDGRAHTLAEQATSPMLNPEEMAMSEADVVSRLANAPEYVARFQRSFPDDKQAVNLGNAAEAIAAFERGLVTKGRWDRYLEGDASALSDDEVQGLRVFLNVGCVGCHTGPEVGASMYQVAGAIEPWPTQDDQGRFEITGDENDRMVFRVPSLKNVEHTAPYFHDGSVSELPKAVQMMGRVQLGVDLTPEEVASIVKFLRALSGELPREYIVRPAVALSTRGAR